LTFVTLAQQLELEPIFVLVLDHIRSSVHRLGASLLLCISTGQQYQ